MHFHCEYLPYSSVWKLKGNEQCLRQIHLYWSVYSLLFKRKFHLVVVWSFFCSELVAVFSIFYSFSGDNFVACLVAHVIDHLRKSGCLEIDPSCLDFLAASLSPVAQLSTELFIKTPSTAFQSIVKCGIICNSHPQWCIVGC